MESTRVTPQPIGRRCLIRQRDGLNLIELAIVMAVVGLIIGGIYVAASAVYRNVRESQLQDDLLQIVQNIRSTYGVQGQIPVGAIGFATLSQAGILPSDAINNGAAIDSFGGAITITGVAAGPPADVTIAMANIPQTVCSDLLVKDSQFGQAGASNIGLVSISGTAGVAAAILAAAFPIPPATASAVANCVAAPGTVTFTYTIQ